MKLPTIKTRKYYKILTTEEDFVRPNLTSNGTLGGSAFACGGSYYHTQTGNSAIYLLFDGNTSTGPTCTAYTGGASVIFYNPEPIKVSKVKASGVTYGGDWYSVIIYGSDDNSNWTKLGSYSHGLVAGCDIENPQVFKYYKLYNPNGFGHDSSGYGGGLGEIYITAKIGSTDVQEVSEDDEWDYYKDVVTYKCIATSGLYYKLYKFTTTGTHTITIPTTLNCSLILVGGGGGGTFAHYTNWNSGHIGGSGALISGNTLINTGTYEVVVGAGGTRKSTSDTGTTVYATAGGDTSAFGNIAGGGGASWSHAGYADVRGANGTGGTYTLQSTGLVGFEGVAGSTTSIYDTYGGGGASTLTNGQDGYAQILLSSDKPFDGYDYYRASITKGFDY